MNSPHILPSSLAELYRRMREALLVEHPDIDPVTLADTLEGSSMLPDILAGLIRAAREDEAMSDALAGMVKDMQERKARLQHRADRRRDMVQALMEHAGLHNLVQPDFTVSIRNNPPKVIFTDEPAIPDEYCRISRLPNINDIRAALKNNIVIAGVSLGNGGQSLSIRVK